MFAAVVALALAVAIPSGGTASAAPSPALTSALGAWTAANPATSAVVWRIDGSEPVEVLEHKAATPRIPASTMKIVTAASALLALSPAFRFETRVYAGPKATQAGPVLTGAVYLKGYGDPTLSTTAYANRYLQGYGGNVRKLAQQLRAHGIRTVRGPLVVDETILDAARDVPTWPARYATECQPLSGMTVNQSYLGNVRGRYVKSPATAAGVQFRIALRQSGVRHVGPVIRGRAPAQGRLYARVSSPPLRVITRLMLPDSDNFLAEMLTKDVGAYTRGVGSTRAGTSQAATILTGRGLYDPANRLVDGSGLARENRLTATTLVRVLAAANAEPAWGSSLLASLPRGSEGTLKRRFREIRNRVRAKTGYISGTSTLAGVVDSVGGSRYAFAFLMNQGSTTAAKETQDRLVRLLAAGAADAI